MVLAIRAYSRRHIVTASVILLLAFGFLVWNQQEHISNTIASSSLLSHPKDPAPSAAAAADTKKKPESSNDDSKDKPSHSSPAEPEATGKTKPRFWTSKGHLLPSVWDYKRPKDVKSIKALVFYGRRQPISILDCYLKRNLKKNGGMLDGVIFVERTGTPEDVALLDRMLLSEPEYYEKWAATENMANMNQFSSGFGNSYDRVEDDVMYIKIDDDIVFMEDSLIPSIVQKKVEHPEFYVVSANVVNQPLLSWVHWNLGAVKPYLPEINKTSPAGHEVDWRPSKLPQWEGTELKDFKLSQWEPSEDGVHRWLPLNQGSHDHILDFTPIERTEYNPYGRGWTEWKIGAQEHYSFLENLEKDELWQYKFGNWDFQYDRMGIQFVAMMGKDINAAKPIDADDENHFSCYMTKKLGRHAVADGRGIAVHYSFGSQRGGMDKTDILERYRSFALENICEGPMLWTPEFEAKAKAEEKKKQQEEKKKQQEEKKKQQEEKKKQDQKKKLQDQKKEEAKKTGGKS